MSKLTDLKKETLPSLISELPDTVYGSASYVKDYFDQNPKALLTMFNSLIDLLAATGSASESGAAAIGFAQGGGIQAGNVQQAIGELLGRIEALENAVAGKDWL